MYLEQFSTEHDFDPQNTHRHSYMIASTPRSGSHYLGHALKETGHFGFPLEYLNTVNLRKWRERLGPDLPATDLFREMVRYRTSESGWFGFKCHWFQFRPVSKSKAIECFSPVCKVIFIYRQDLLGQAISYSKAAQTGSWISGTQERAVPKFNYDGIVTHARKLRSQNGRWRRHLSKSGVDVLTIAFEELTREPEQGLRGVFDFLDPEHSLTPVVAARTKKQSNAETDEWRTQFQEQCREEHDWILQKQILDQ